MTGRGEFRPPPKPKHVIGRPTQLTFRPEEHEVWQQARDLLFEHRKLTNTFPSSTCNDGGCRFGACCKRTWHHAGDMCLHCGNDERDDG